MPFKNFLTETTKWLELVHTGNRWIKNSAQARILGSLFIEVADSYAAPIKSYMTPVKNILRYCGSKLHLALATVGAYIEHVAIFINFRLLYNTTASFLDFAGNQGISRGGKIITETIKMSLVVWEKGLGSVIGTWPFVAYVFTIGEIVYRNNVKAADLATYEQERNALKLIDVMGKIKTFRADKFLSRSERHLFNNSNHPSRKKFDTKPLTLSISSILKVGTAVMPGGVFKIFKELNDGEKKGVLGALFVTMLNLGAYSTLSFRHSREINTKLNMKIEEQGLSATLPHDLDGIYIRSLQEKVNIEAICLLLNLEKPNLLAQAAIPRPESPPAQTGRRRSLQHASIPLTAIKSKRAEIIDAWVNQPMPGIVENLQQFARRRVDVWRANFDMLPCPTPTIDEPQFWRNVIDHVRQNDPKLECLLR